MGLAIHSSRSAAPWQHSLRQQFQVGPQPLTGIQLGGIGREPLQTDLVGRAVRHKGLDHVAAMNWGAIPDEHQTAGHFPQQILQKGDHILRIERTILAGEIQLALGGHGADGRAMIPGPPLPQDGRVPHRGIGADDTEQGREAGLVDEEDGLPLGLCPLLMAGQVFSRQRAMAASSRWRARRAGLCGRQCIALSKRPTWTGWEEIPHARLSTAAIRPQVQTCPRKP
jgi:hypothetical protein